MNIRTMIEKLESIARMCGEDQIVESWCPDGEGWYPVSGFVYAGEDNLVRIFNDE